MNRYLFYIFALLVLALPHVTRGTQTEFAIELILTGIFALSLNILIGRLGLISFGHGMFLGVGAYLAAFQLRNMTDNLFLLNEYLGAVSIQASERITTPEESSEIPITIVNESDKSVSVSVSLTSNAASRFTAESSGLIQVDSGQRITVPVAVTLVGAGVVDVQAQLIAPNGERFGEVENIQISSAAYSQFARTLVWGAFGLLVLLALSNFVKRRKDKRSIETAR